MVVFKLVANGIRCDHSARLAHSALEPLTITKTPVHTIEHCVKSVYHTVRVRMFLVGNVQDTSPSLYVRNVDIGLNTLRYFECST